VQFGHFRRKRAILLFSGFSGVIEVYYPVPHIGDLVPESRIIFHHRFELLEEVVAVEECFV